MEVGHAVGGDDQDGSGWNDIRLSSARGASAVPIDGQLNQKSYTHIDFTLSQHEQPLQ